MRLEKADLAKFAKWLASCGAEIIAPTSEWEVLRVKMKGETHVAYRDKSGAQTWPKPLAEAYKLRSCGHQPQLANPVKQLRGNRKARLHELARRDGWVCWYCDAPLTEDTATVEEVCPRQIGGPVHVGNQCLACPDCNRAAGNLSVVAKVAFREARGPCTCRAVDDRIAAQPDTSGRSACSQAPRGASGWRNDD